MKENFNNKITVNNDASGAGEQVIAHHTYTVPRNSSTNCNQNAGLNKQPIENSTKASIQAPKCRCPHCENMAKNFLYLESLIRLNCKNSKECSVCYSSLRYLSYVNKSIMKVFGSFDSIVEAARAFGHKTKQKSKSTNSAKNLDKKPKVPIKMKGLHPLKKRETFSNIFKRGKNTKSRHSATKSLNKLSTAKKRNNKSKSIMIPSNYSALNSDKMKKSGSTSKAQKIKSLKRKRNSFARKQ